MTPRDESIDVKSYEALMSARTTQQMIEGFMKRWSPHMDTGHQFNAELAYLMQRVTSYATEPITRQFIEFVSRATTTITVGESNAERRLKIAYDALAEVRKLCYESNVTTAPEATLACIRVSEEAIRQIEEGKTK